MSKKILLRRPRCVINDIKNFEDIIRETETRLTSFKDDIQPEIDQLDKDYLEALSQNEINDNEIIINKSDKKEIILKSTKANEFAIVSVCDINEGLLPIKSDVLLKHRSDSKKVEISNKTLKEFEKFQNFSVKEKKLFQQNIFEQIGEQLPILNKSIPKHIIIIQLAALLKCQLSDKIDRNVGCVVKSLPKKGNFPMNSNPKYEIILYENENIRDLKSISSHKISDILQKDLINSANRDNHKTDIDEDVYQDITPTKVSMMECLMTGKKYLNFAAHSIYKIPTIIDIFRNLSSLNLSYNKFKLIPEEVYLLQNLESLDIRNNPLQIIDDSISNLNCLKIFICSFTLITTIPSGLFRCENLEQADLSYNNISCIPHVDSLSNLKVLNLSGNPIKYFKKSFTKLNLENLGLENTWIHPIFWKDGEFALEDFENLWGFCDLCDQIITDGSINYIAFTRKFNHILPILMSFCSTLCRDSI